MSRRLPLALLLLLLAACATPEQRCVGPTMAELRTVERLIAETERNIARGYAIAREPGVRTRLTTCLPGDGPYTFCVYDQPVVRDRPVAIDRRSERAKLETLFERRAELQREARARFAACGF